MKEIKSGIQKRLKFFALLMGIIMFSYIILYSIPLIQKDIDYKLRNIETDIQTAAYEYNAYQEIIEFNEFEVYDLDDFIIKFEGSRNFTVSEMNFYDIYDIFDENEEVNVKFTIEFNKETTELMAYLEYYQFENIFLEENIIIQSVEYDNETENWWFVFEDGTSLTSEELLENDGIDNCAFIITAAAATVINVVCQVVITVCIVVIVYHVLKWFFSWISGTRISYRNVEKVVEETRVATTPAIMINGFRYETVAKTKEEIETLVKTKTKTADDKEEYVYYLAFSAGIAYDGVSSDYTIEPNGLYIGPEISFEQACGILTSQIYTTCEHDGISFSYIPSIYSYWEYGVLEVLNQPNVGYHPNTLYGCPESHNGGLYHYHPAECYYVAIPFLKNGREVSKNYRPHAFFMGHNVSGYLTY